MVKKFCDRWGNGMCSGFQHTGRDPVQAIVIPVTLELVFVQEHTVVGSDGNEEVSTLDSMNYGGTLH